MTARPLTLSRGQVLALRRRNGTLEERLPAGPASFRRAAWSGMQDSVPRAGLHALHARVAGVLPGDWEEPSLVQVWGPRYTAYVVPAEDVAPFTLGRLPADRSRRALAENLAEELHRALGGRAVPYGDAGRVLGVHPNHLRYAAPTGRVLIRWEGARQPQVRTVSAPDVEPDEAARELVRRYLHVLGPGSPETFARWAGVGAERAAETFASLGGELTAVRTPVGEAWILAGDEPAAVEDGPVGGVRLLPSGDPYLLLHGPDRELLVPDAGRRDQVWTPRVWPGALLVRGEVTGTWRRTTGRVVVRAWRPLPRRDREDVEAEAASLPVPGLAGRPSVRWED